MNTALVLIALVEGLLALAICSDLNTRLKYWEDRYEREHGMDETDPRFMI